MPSCTLPWPARHSDIVQEGTPMQRLQREVEATTAGQQMARLLCAV